MSGDLYTMCEAARKLGISRLHLTRLVQTSCVPALDGYLDERGMARAAQVIADGRAELAERFANAERIRAGAVAAVAAALA